MSIIRATATLQKRSSIPVDAAINVWHWEADSALSSDAEALIDFYQTISPNLSTAVSDGANGITVELAFVTPGGPGAADDTVSSPVITETADLGTPGSLSASSHVAEVAACLSLAGDLSGFPEESGTTRPRARRRGRVYLGPLSVGTTTNDVATGDVFFTSTFMDAVLDAAELLQSTLDATGAVLGIYSRTMGVLVPAETCWMDNAPDIIRSRGVQASARDTRTF